MRLPKTILVIVISLSVAYCDTRENDEDETSSVFIEAAKKLFSDKETLGGLEKGFVNTFAQPDSGKGQRSSDGLSQVISQIGNAFLGDDQGRGQAPGLDLSMFGPMIDLLANSGNRRARKVSEADEPAPAGFDFESALGLASMFLGQGNNNDNNNNLGGLMGFLPMVLSNFNSGSDSGEETDNPHRPHDHSSHSWFLPPILENIHVMWDHFSNSELGQALWKNSGLANIVGQMVDERGNLNYEKILDSFDNPALRRRWIKSLTNFVSEWISHVSDPAIQQRYLATAQFIGNSLLKSQGYPKAAMFDSNKPAESITRLVNAVAKRHLNMKIDSSQYIKPAVAYFRELMVLASEKGFIMSKINARELSHRLSEVINNDLVGPILKAYRAYKWAVKSPKCASHILCVINQHNITNPDDKVAIVRQTLTRLSSYPAAWAISNKSNLSFWSLYGAIQESNACFEKYPVDCNDFHEEEIRVTTEYVHNEL